MRYNVSDFDDYYLDVAREGSSPAPDSPGDGSLGLLAPVLETCAFLQHCRDDAAALPEPEWYAMLSNLVRLEGGRQAAHAFSRPYPHYSCAETDVKLDHALEAAGPHTCRHIQEQLGFRGCPPEGHGVRSPAGLGWPRRTARNGDDTEPTSSGGHPDASTTQGALSDASAQATSSPGPETTTAPRGRPLIPDAALEPLEAFQPDDHAAIRLTEAQAHALVDPVPYSDLEDATDMMVSNWAAKWFAAGLRASPAEPWPRWWTGTHWADDQVRGRFAQCVMLTTRWLRAAAQQKTVEIPAHVLEQKGAQLRTKHPKMLTTEIAARAEAEARADLDKELRRYRDHAKLEAVSRRVVLTPPIRIDVERFDADPWLLNVRNGTIELRTGTLRPHDSADLITRVIDLPYDPGAPCPRFRQFVQELFPPDPDTTDLARAQTHAAALVTFLQTFVGYCLTGDVAAQILVIFTGHGSNGKSTLLAVLTRVFGPYVRMLQSVVLLDDPRGRSASSERMHEYARLKGVRLAVIAEPPPEDQLSEGALKHLTGGDRLTGRHPYRPAFDFDPTHKLLIVANDPPTLRSQGLAVWRRPKILPFRQRFWNRTDPDFETKPVGAPVANEHLLDTLLEELPGILAWAVAGARRYAADGLVAPEAVQLPTVAYRQDQDPLTDFLDECTDRTPEAWTPFALLYGEYATWRKTTLGLRPDATWTPDLTETKFGRLLGEHGFPSVPGSVEGRKARGRRGLAVRPWRPQP